MRRLPTVLIALALLAFTSTANALTVRDVIELSKAGVSDQVLLALIQVDRRVYTIDAEAVKSMKAAGVSDTVMLAMINAGREDPLTAPAASSEAPVVPADAAAQAGMAPQPQVVVIDHTSSQPAVREVPVIVPVAVPVAVPVGVPPYGALRQQTVSTIITTDTGAAVRARVPVPPNCVKAEPIYWGNGGKRRPGTWAPPAQIVCR